MKIILRADVENLGRLGDVVTVKAGYGRNYLLPQGLAMLVTPGNLKAFELERKKLQARMDALRAAVEELESKFPDSDLIFIESGGDNLTLTFSPALADFFIYVIDVAAGDKIPRKSGPGVCQSDILVINKEDLAPYVKASLEVMDRDSRKMRGGKPFIFTNCMTGKNIEELTDMIIRDALFDFKPAEKTA